MKVSGVYPRMLSVSHLQEDCQCASPMAIIVQPKRVISVPLRRLSVCLHQDCQCYMNHLCYIYICRGGPSTYVYCVICYHVIAAPYVRNVVVSLHTDDDLEHPMDYELSLLPKVFSKHVLYLGLAHSPAM